MSLSTSTTSTTAYILTKYSRAYPSNSRAQDSEPEWQHFTNPTIRLILEMRKSSSGELESYRSRVLWSLNSGDDSMDVDQNEVTFEDLELLSFSSPSMLQGQKQLFAIHGLPLKAVYRDAIVGIRYQHPRIPTAGTTPTYRRFQMNFKDAADAISYVDAIRPVCPCKANPTAAPAGLPARAMTMAPPRTSGSSSGASGSMQHIAQPVPKSVLRPAMTMQPSRPPAFPGRRQIVSDNLEDGGALAQTDAQPAPTDSCAMVIDSIVPQLAVDLARPVTAASAATHDSFTRVSEISEPAQLPSPESSPISVSMEQVMQARPLPLAPSAPAIHDHAAPTCSLNTSPLSAQPSLPPCTNITHPDTAQTEDSREAFLTSLREVPPLYDLTRVELENLVAEVVREDGFLTLVRNLDSMWKLKTLLPPVVAESA